MGTGVLAGGGVPLLALLGWVRVTFSGRIPLVCEGAVRLYVKER